ncbi:MAG: hypothetical protein AB203_01315 [Parcubacteria bacterium C7867-008]|nr:MAG: hypothetical protein AB203_01315 [Parcubacteria bacterium C7867-008]
MKRPYLHRTSARTRNALITPGQAIAGVLIFIMIVLAIIRFAAPGVFIAIASPLWGTGSLVGNGIEYVTKGFKNSVIVANERDQLVTENVVLQADNLRLSTRIHDLEALLGSRTEAAPGILAAVLARPPVAPYDVLIIDQGTESGVSLGSTAYGPGGTPVGTVASVAAKSSRITLYSNPGLETAAWVGEARTPVMVKGSGSGAFTAELPKAAGVTEGQGVYIAGAGALPIGSVARIDSDPSSPNVVLHVHPYVNPFSLVWVTVSRSNP